MPLNAAPPLQASTLRVGNYEGEEAYVPFKSLLPMVEPNDIVFGGWDISGLNCAEAMERAQVREEAGVSSGGGDELRRGDGARSGEEEPPHWASRTHTPLGPKPTSWHRMRAL